MAEQSSTTASIELNDAMVCGQHCKEQCSDCDVDFRQENDEFFGFNPVERAPLDIPLINYNTKENVHQCKKHSNAECAQCFNWKKQIHKLHKDAKKGK